jgi:hypothetical protein
MKKRAAFVCFLVFLVTGALSAQSHSVDIDTGIRRSAEYFERQLHRGISIAVLSVRSDSWTLSEYIIDELSSHFVNGRYFTVVDRRNLDIVQREIDFQLSGEVSDETALAIGQRIGAETVILGSILLVDNEYRLDLRALSVATGVIQGLHRQDIRIDRRLSALLGGSHVAPVSDAWYHNRFFVGLRAGGGGYPPMFGGYSGGRNVHAAVSLTGQVTDLFGIQTELMWSYYMDVVGGWERYYEADRAEHRLLIPLLARFTFRTGNFSYGGFGGAYLTFPGRMRLRYSNIEENWNPRSGPGVGVMLGGNFGYHIGPGVLFFDLRAHMDIIEPEYVIRTYRGGHQFIYSWHDSLTRGGFNLSVGYEIGILGRR